MGGGAWPFLVGGVICLVNSVNERDLSLLTSYAKDPLRGQLLRGTIGVYLMEVLGNNSSTLIHRQTHSRFITLHRALKILSPAADFGKCRNFHQRQVPELEISTALAVPAWHCFLKLSGTGVPDLPLR